MRSHSVATATVALFALACTPPSDEVSSRFGAVVSSHTLASDAGARVLEQGGNAVDAAVATAFALAVTHPSAGNIGGGGFMVIRLADGTATTIDYREKAPALSTPTMYLDKKGEIADAATDSGWIAPGVPGTVRGLALAHRRYGRLPWKDLVAPSITLAESGFPLSRRLARALNRRLDSAWVAFPTTLATYGKPAGGKWAEGDTLRLPQLARALKAIAEEGPDAFYTGWIADSIDAQMRAHKGLIRKEDLAAYEAVERAPVRGTFRGHEVIGMGPPSSGGPVTLLVLAQLEALGVEGLTRDSVTYLHRRAEASRRAFLERARWLGDPDFSRIPLERILARGYADSLASSVDAAHASSSLALATGLVIDTVAPKESKETTHFSVVDSEGNAVSNTYTLESSYGSGVVIAGFLMNNEMGDFNKRPGYTNNGWAIGTPANLIVPGKRMLSSMSPTIVTKDGKLLLVTGSPGGRTIPNTTLDVILGVTLFGETVRQAVDAPRFHHQWMPDTLEMEKGGAPAGVIAALRAMGHAVVETDSLSQGEAHSILWDARSGTAHAAHDKRGDDAGASAPKRAPVRVPSRRPPG